jgi:hypothetical protein
MFLVHSRGYSTGAHGLSTEGGRRQRDRGALGAPVLGILTVSAGAGMQWPAPIMELPAYAIGCMAAFWFVERVGSVLSGAS